MSSTDRLFRSIRTVQCGLTRRMLEARIEPIQLYVRLSLRLLGQQAYHVWLREFFRYYKCIYIYIHIYIYTTSQMYVITPPNFYFPS